MIIVNNILVYIDLYMHISIKYLLRLGFDHINPWDTFPSTTSRYLWPSWQQMRPMSFAPRKRSFQGPLPALPVVHLQVPADQRCVCPCDVPTEAKAGKTVGFFFKQTIKTKTQRSLKHSTFVYEAVQIMCPKKPSFCSHQHYFFSRWLQVHMFLIEWKSQTLKVMVYLKIYLHLSNL